MNTMKRTAKCPKCESTRVMHIERVADAGETGDFHPGTLLPGVGPVARSILLQRWVEPGGFLVAPRARFKVTGETEAYVCADCGYLEEYLRDPQSVAWDEVVGAQPHTPQGGGGPFR